ncbi:protein O4 [macacine betaherpesvirus 3]|nr:protein O4 [macacine betaherpesvirus 3]
MPGTIIVVFISLGVIGGLSLIIFGSFCLWKLYDRMLQYFYKYKRLNPMEATAIEQ